MLRVGAAVLALALAGCDTLPGAKAPDGIAAAIATEARSIKESDRPDAHLETFLARLDLPSAFGPRAEEIAAQIRSSRAAAAAATTAKSGTAGGHRASLASAGPQSIFSVPIFAKTLAGVLEPLTSHGGSQTVPEKPFESTQAGAEATTTTTLTTASTYTGAGSVVTLRLQWTYRTKTVDKAGLPLLDMIDERLLVGTIDVCPDAGGTAPASLEAKAVVGATKLVNGAGLQIHSESSSTNRFSGKVDDTATLRSVRQDFTEKASWQTASGSGSYQSTLSAGRNASASGSFVAGFDASTFSGSFTSSGDHAGVNVSGATAWTLTIDAWALEEPFQEAQRLWRNGRCVVVQAPDYNAETPIEAFEQTKPQHDERVDPDSETKFAVGLKHRYQGTLSQPITAALTSGGKSLEPGRVDSVPSSLTYRAPAEEDQRASATLRSVSKRGIGTLVLDFHTGADSLSLTITGELSSTGNPLGGTARVLDRVTIGPVVFKKATGDVYVGTGRWTAQISSFTAVGLGTNTCEGTESGDVEMMARLERRGQESVWVIDPRDASAEGAGTETCTNSLGGTTLRGVTLPTTVTVESTGDSGGIYLGMLRPFTLPAGGGSVAVGGSQGGGDMGTWSASGTAEGRPASR